MQRWSFLFVALLAVLTSLLLPRLNPQIEIVVMGALILLLGVPHGALDLLYLRKVNGLSQPSQITLAVAGYLFVAAAVVGLWLVSPSWFLLCFLIAASFHFSGDPLERASLLSRIAVGGGVVTLPTLTHGPELKHLYSILTNESAASFIVSLSLPIAWLMLTCGLAAMAYEVHERNIETAIDVLMTMTLAILAPPLLAFTVYFCLMHSARHILRTVDLVNISRRAFAIECVLPMVGVFLTGFAAWSFQSSLSVDAKFIQVLFVLLAALTAPHMVIIEPIRLSGWKKPQAAAVPSSDGSIV